jgi:primase-polymerase (primpol)-like protein
MSINIVAHFNPNGIPDYLKQRPQWIVWGKRSKKSQNALLQNGKLNGNSSEQDTVVLPTNHKPTST